MKYVSVFLTFVFSLSLMGCSSTPAPAEPSEDTPPPREAQNTVPANTSLPTPAPVPPPTPTPAPEPTVKTTTTTTTTATVPPVVDTTPTPVSVSISGFKFASSSLKVKVGTRVTWTNNDSAPHNVTSTDGTGTLGSDDLAKGESFSFTFSKAGTYTYNCSIHPSMTGTVTVE